MKNLILALLFCVSAFATCPTGFVEVTGPALSPDGTAFNGRMVLDPGVNTTVNGQSVRRNRVTVTVTAGVLDVCLAPGTYTDTNFVTGSTLSYPTTWAVSAPGPLLIQNIELSGAAAPAGTPLPMATGTFCLNVAAGPVYSWVACTGGSIITSATWHTLTNSQWTGLTNSQWTGLTN